MQFSNFADLRNFYNNSNSIILPRVGMIYKDSKNILSDDINQKYYIIRKITSCFIIVDELIMTRNNGLFKLFENPLSITKKIKIDKLLSTNFYNKNPQTLKYELINLNNTYAGNQYYMHLLA